MAKNTRLMAAMAVVILVAVAMIGASVLPSSGTTSRNPFGTSAKNPSGDNYWRFHFINTFGIDRVRDFKGETLDEALENFRYYERGAWPYCVEFPEERLQCLPRSVNN